MCSSLSDSDAHEHGLVGGVELSQQGAEEDADSGVAEHEDGEVAEARVALGCNSIDIWDKGWSLRTTLKTT